MNRFVYMISEFKNEIIIDDIDLCCHCESPCTGHLCSDCQRNDDGFCASYPQHCKNKGKTFDENITRNQNHKKRGNLPILTISDTMTCNDTFNLTLSKM